MDKNQLHISNVTIEDKGKYTCFATNSFGVISSSTTVTVSGLPPLEMSTATSYVLVHKEASLTCAREDNRNFQNFSKLELIGNGRSFQKWSFSSMHLKNAVHANFTFIATLNSTGYYQCKGTIGMTAVYSSVVEIKVGTPSDPVVFENNTMSSTTGIKVSWMPIPKKFWNQELVTFEVNVSLHPSITPVQSFLTTRTSATISNLQPNTTYTVTVSGRTVFGRFDRATSAVVKTKPNTNSKRFKLEIKLTDEEFSNSLDDPASSDYKQLKSRVEESVNGVYKESAIKFQYIETKITGFRRGSVIAVMVVSLDGQFSGSTAVLVQEINKEERLVDSKFEKSFTNVTDFNECKDSDFNTCHEYAHCKNVFGTYFCSCFKGFFGDGENCEGPPQIIKRSPENITKYVESNVTLVCMVIGNPNPITSWKYNEKNGKWVEIESTSNKFGGNYTMHTARVEDSGSYVCNSSNSLGWDSYMTTIIIKPVTVNIDVEIKLSNKTFQDELKNKSSQIYKELETDVRQELVNFFNDTPGFKDVEILEFVEGSVKVIFRVIMNVYKPSKETKDVVAVNVGHKIIKQLKTGRIGTMQVIPDAIQLKVPPPPPANLTYSDVEETRAYISWDAPELHEMFSIERYYIFYRKYGEKNWSNKTVDATLNRSATAFQVDNLESDTFYIVMVVAENAYGRSKRNIKMEIKTKKVMEDVSPWYYIGPIIVFVVLVLLVMIIFFVKRSVKRSASDLVGDGKPKKQSEKSEVSLQMSEWKRANENTYTNTAFSDTLSHSSWKEIRRTSIVLSKDTLIPGFKVTVIHGTLSGDRENKKEACLVKMTKEHATADDRRELMAELKIISGMSGHKNIVNLIGACTSEAGPILLVLEFCSRGTLESNLREHQKKKQLFISKTKMSLENEIARGMSHLADSRIVHRDLAARNILLTDDFTPKLFNFAVSYDVHERESYNKLSPGTLRNRWLALESLTDGLYSSKSNVWSFAVLMWEIETGGEVPYEEYEVADLVGKINGGYRLPIPEGTPNEIYRLMLQCWDPNPDHRPTFYEIIEIIQMHLGKDEHPVDVPFYISP